MGIFIWISQVKMNASTIGIAEESFLDEGPDRPLGKGRMKLWIACPDAQNL